MSVLFLNLYKITIAFTTKNPARQSRILHTQRLPSRENYFVVADGR